MAEVTSDPVIRMRHARACGYCSSGVREWFALHGLDYGLFLEAGLPASVFTAIGDPLPLRMVAAEAQERAEQGNG